MGFGADIKSSTEIKTKNVLKEILPEDLIRYGLIPEFVGRLPCMMCHLLKI
jgi:ATP-dependent Clp protease ATP-binding subunit ClpX